MAMQSTQKMTRDALDILREDHRDIQEFFAQFEGGDDQTRHTVAARAMRALTMHSQLEEKVFYPAIRQAVGHELIDQAEQAHHVAKLLMTELRILPFGERYNAKFAVLAKTVRQHIQEEENDIFPRTEKAGVNLVELGRRMERLMLRVPATRRSFGSAVLMAGAFIALAALVVNGTRASRR